MGDAGYDERELSRESFRLSTYDAHTLDNVKNQLARAGFYYTRNGLKVKCFACNYEVDAEQITPETDIVKLHKEKVPDCKFAKLLEPIKNSRSKKFLSYDSLRFEKERLETFIEWPIAWLSPEDLAADGFYYLRTNDHCACVFCRGIVGAWESGDTPRGEHKRHFPHCPFIRGQPVGNVPLTHSSILDKLPLDGEECPIPSPRCEYSIDEAGPGTSSSVSIGPTGNRHMVGSYAECKGPSPTNDVNFDAIGLRQYSGPKRKEFVTKESRLNSFSRWPERVAQKPEEMADAGFFCCGLSDHVRCFHCGNGLRNWEVDDKPWEEHARWYPDCNYVILSKGQEFIDKVRREKPPYIRTVAATNNKPQKNKASSGQFKSLSDSDLEPLMKLDIIQAVSSMGFPLNTIRKALRQKLEQTGLPFFSLEPCIEAVLQVMEEETRQAIQPSDNVEDEAMARQNDKLQALRIESHSTSSQGESSNHTVEQPSSVTATPSTPSSLNSNNNEDIPPSTSTNATLATNTELTTSNTATTQLQVNNSSEQLDTRPSEQSSNSQVEDMEIDDDNETTANTEISEGQIEEVPTGSQTMTNSSSNTSLASYTVAVIREADEIMNVADEILKKPINSGASSLEMKIEGTSTGVTLEDKQCNVEKTDVTAAEPSQKEIAEELERIRESRLCKICMDAEMSVVFLPCTHMATCSSCAVTMAQCPICRVDIKYTIKPIIS